MPACDPALKKFLPTRGGQIFTEADRPALVTRVTVRDTPQACDLRKSHVTLFCPAKKYAHGGVAAGYRRRSAIRPAH
jgi:hypothetical protein